MRRGAVRRLLTRQLVQSGLLDIDALNQGFCEIGLGSVVEVAVMIMVDPRPVVRLPRVTRNDGAGSVYVISSTNGLFKIGSARNVERRIRSLQTGSADQLEIVCVIPTAQHTHAALERALHHRLADKRVSGEWFDLTDADLLALQAMSRESVS